MPPPRFQWKLSAFLGFAALFWFGSVQPFLQADQQEKSIQETIADIFAPSLPAPGSSNLKDFKEVSARLDGVGLGPGKAFAVINGKIYREGEEKEGIQVTHIRKKEVDILINGTPETLQLIHYEGLAGVRTKKEENTQTRRASDEPKAAEKPES